MLLSSLLLEHFRSYTKKKFIFVPQVTLITGVNTAGKTNILEAIYLLATGKSFRAELERDMIAWGADFGRAGVETIEDKLEIVLTNGQLNGAKSPTKKYFVNGVSRRQLDFVGRLRAVLFWPEHLSLVIGSPSGRRKYLDSILVQVDREYRRNLHSYERGLRQRNRLLEAIRDRKAERSQLIFWDQLLIATGGYITDKRASLIAFINEFRVSSLELSIEYDKSVISPSRLAQYATEEVAAKSTLVGPHRDDFSINKRQEARDKRQEERVVSLSAFGSRGEQRLAVLWMKLAELSYIQQEVGERPVLLLDDIFSELDPEHRELVVSAIKQQQTIITSADPEAQALVESLLGESVHVITLDNGS